MQVVLQVGQQRLQLPVVDGVAQQRGVARVDAAHLVDLLEQRHIHAGQTARLTGQRHLALYDGEDGLNAQHTARHSCSGGQSAALAQVLQIVHGSYQMQVLLGLFQIGSDLGDGFSGVPQLYRQTHQQRLSQTDVFGVHEHHIVHVGKVGSKSGALTGAGQRIGQEDAQHLVSGGSGVQIQPLELLRAGLAGGGQLAAGCQMGIVFAGGHVDAVPQDGAVLQRHVQGDHGHAQLLRLGGQNIAGGIGEDTDHNNTSGLPVKYSIRNVFIKKVGNYYTTIQVDVSIFCINLPRQNAQTLHTRRQIWYYNRERTTAGGDRPCTS